jgi:hypothetical protein
MKLRKKGSSPDRRKKSQERAREGTQSVVSQLQIRRRSLGASEAESTGWLRDQDVNLKALHTHDPSMNRMPVFNSMNHRLVNYCSPACRSRNSCLWRENPPLQPEPLDSEDLSFRQHIACSVLYI